LTNRHFSVLNQYFQKINCWKNIKIIIKNIYLKKAKKFVILLS
jgi:hypothetical protein